jgi:hypothetical protein
LELCRSFEIIHKIEKKQRPHGPALANELLVVARLSLVPTLADEQLAVAVLSFVGCAFAKKAAGHSTEQVGSTACGHGV